MTTTDSRHDERADARPHSPRSVSPLDATFDALASPECRALLGHLADSEEDALVVADLAASLADDEGVSEENRLRVDLHHTHLPRLDAANLLDYDAGRGFLRAGSSARLDAIHSTVEEYEAAGRPVSIDALCDLLADFRRRTAYLTLCSHGDLSLPDLADEVAVAERGDALPKIDPDEVLGVYLSLYHKHVPKLADAGLVVYDQEGDYVALAETGRALESPVRNLCAVADS